MSAYRLTESNTKRTRSISSARANIAGSLVLVSVVALVSCSLTHSTPASSRTIVDELGRTVIVSHHPQRIVSLAPSITETLFAIGAGDRVAGVTSYCDYPPEARAKEKVGDTLKPNIERIIGLKSDLVIVSTSSQLEQYVQKLEDLRVPVYISNPRNLDAVLESISAIGRLAGAENRSREVVANMRARIENVAKRLEGSARPRVLFMLGMEPLITVGSGTFLDDLITRAGGQSISTDATGEYPQYSLETAVAKGPEIIFIQFDEKELPDRLRQTPAGLAGRVYHIDDDLVSRPGPRIVAGLEQMAAKIHPEVKWQ
ncbi:MAG TPA: cobalamin-binding protein [Blastocatellia bacterium]|nr:cobalamin-binding protein [Blastocatellia bacterium]